MNAKESGKLVGGERGLWAKKGEQEMEESAENFPSADVITRRIFDIILVRSSVACIRANFLAPFLPLPPTPLPSPPP